MRGSASRPGRSLPQERHGTHCTGGWVGPRASLDRYGKFRLNRDSIPGTVQPVASRYTDYATRPKFTSVKKVKCTLVQALRPCTGRRPIGGVEVELYSFLTTALEGGEGVSVTPRPLFTPGKTQYPWYRRLGGPQGRSGQVREISPPPGSIPDRPARSQSLHRLSYRAHYACVEISYC